MTDPAENAVPTHDSDAQDAQRDVDAQIAARAAALSLADEFEAAGLDYVELDEHGLVVRRTPPDYH